MDKDHPGNMLKQELIQIQIIRYLLPALLNFLYYRIYFFIQYFIFSRLYLKAFGVIPELVDMLQLMILHSLKEIAQVILHFNS